MKPVKNHVLRRNVSAKIGLRNSAIGIFDIKNTLRSQNCGSDQVKSTLKYARHCRNIRGLSNERSLALKEARIHKPAQYFDSS